MDGFAVLETASTGEVVTTAELNKYLYISTTADDSFVETFNTAARADLEDRYGWSFRTQTWKYYLDNWPATDTLQIPKPPLVSISSIKYIDSTGGTTSTFSSTNYFTNINGYLGEVVLEPDASWPGGTLRPANPIIVEFVSGYGGSSQVPKTIRQAVLFRAMELFENRDPARPANMVPVGNQTIGTLMSSYTDYRF